LSVGLEGSNHVADPIDLTLEYLRRLDGKLDDVRADLDEVRAALRSLEDRQLGVERSIGLVREDMARRDRRSDALAGRVKRIERRLELSELPGR
jgi:septation ring formation regulator EzrA